MIPGSKDVPPNPNFIFFYSKKNRNVWKNPALSLSIEEISCERFLQLAAQKYLKSKGENDGRTDLQ